MKRQTLNQKGFSHIEILIVIVVLAAVIGIGTYVAKTHNTNKSQALNTAALAPSASKSAVAATTSTTAPLATAGAATAIPSPTIQSNGSVALNTTNGVVPSSAAINTMTNSKSSLQGALTVINADTTNETNDQASVNAALNYPATQ